LLPPAVSVCFSDVVVKKLTRGMRTANLFSLGTSPV